MKSGITSLALLFALCVSPLSLADKGPAVPDYPPEQVTENVYVIHGPLEMPNPRNQGFMNNPAFIITNDGIVVIDPGASVQSGEMLLRVMEKVSRLPVIAVFNTHIHGDHWLGNQAIRAVYPDVPIYGHPNMLALIEAGEGHSWVELMEQLTEGKTAGTRMVGPTLAVDHGDAFTYGGVTFKVHHYGQAHTTSDIMIEVPDYSISFLGDNVLHNRMPRIDDGNIQGNLESCTRIMETGSKTYVPGHGPSGDDKVPKLYCTYLETLYTTVRKYYEEGLSDFEMKDQVAAALGAYTDWSGFDEQLGRHISVAYLQIEAAEF